MRDVPVTTCSSKPVTSKTLLFKSTLPAIDVPFILFLDIQFLSLFNLFYHLSFLRHPLYFCQKQSVDFPVDCSALPQSQTWRQVWREGEKQTERGWNAHKNRGQKRRLRALMIWNPFWRSLISVPPGAPQWADSTAVLHSVTCSRSPVCLSPSLSQATQRAAPSSVTISPLLTLHSHSRGKCATHILTPCTTAQPASWGDLQGAFNYMCMSFATERQNAALNSSSGRQAAEETDKEKPKSTQRTEIKEMRMGKKE